jgi:hypothetical protein
VGAGGILMRDFLVRLGMFLVAGMGGPMDFAMGEWFMSVIFSS